MVGRWRNLAVSEDDGQQDRKLFSKGKALTGDEAVRSVSENWSKSHIARLRVNGRGKMAINAVSEYDDGIKPVKVRVRKKKRSE